MTKPTYKAETRSWVITGSPGQFDWPRSKADCVRIMKVFIERWDKVGTLVCYK